MNSIKTSESSAIWTGKKVGGSHTGNINLKDGNLTFNNGELTSGKAIIDMTSITVIDLTGETKEKLEGHLKSEDFFSVETNPEATLNFTEVDKKSDGVYDVTAAMTLKGITNPVNFELTTTDDTATTTLVIDRSQFNVRYGSKSFFNDLGDKMIHDNFHVDVVLKF